MKFAKTIKMTALAGLSAIALAGSVATPASARETVTRCDRDGAMCERLNCNDWGNDCRRVGYVDRGYRYENYVDRGHRQLICDRWGHSCHYIWVDGRGYYRGPNGVQLRFNVR